MSTPQPIQLLSPRPCLMVKLDKLLEVVTYSPRNVYMLLIRLLLISSLCISPQIYADITDILVQRGKLRFVLPVDQTRNSMLIQYRTKTRKIVRIVIDRLMITNMQTYRSYRLQDRAARPDNQVDNEGYWTTDILYEGLNVTDSSHRVEGRVTLYSAGSQRSRNFNVYLRPDRTREPSHSTIDWGINE